MEIRECLFAGLYAIALAGEQQQQYTYTRTVVVLFDGQLNGKIGINWFYDATLICPSPSVWLAGSSE